MVMFIWKVKEIVLIWWIVKYGYGDVMIYRYMVVLELMHTH